MIELVNWRKHLVPSVVAAVPLFFIGANISGCGVGQTAPASTVSTSPEKAGVSRNLLANQNKLESSHRIHPLVFGPAMPAAPVLAKIQSYAATQTAPQEIPILMYHSISNHPKNTLCVAPARFAEEMKHLYEAGYHPIGFNDLNQAWLQHQPLPKKPILITFDDGYEDNYQAAYPVLKKYNFRATIFIVTNFVGRPNMLTWDQIHFLDQDGLIQFGSHTLDHLDLAHMSVEQQKRQIFASKQILEQKLGHPVPAFCFPSGRYNSTTLQLLQQAGYEFAVTTHPGSADMNQGRWSLDRVRVSGDEAVSAFDSIFS
ncbi:polysaccharide deacetylase family protein [Fodinisporobacter ferrooxydans]|uniref:Polysaccharide deacetylase family protein n=1 Tax=Fodinisporobacter ferrooxydans TaxID=2901836 RepID=A0ABY4CLW0_9BACL|nr:polysaccharide deacetylase family protein [Alicyclobacillaceae bacterium MYW30-H2]